MNVKKKINKVVKLMDRSEYTKALKIARKLDTKDILGLSSVENSVLSDIKELENAKLFNIAYDYAVGQTVAKNEGKMMLILMLLVSVGYEPALDVVKEVLSC